MSESTVIGPENSTDRHGGTEPNQGDQASARTRHGWKRWAKWLGIFLAVVMIAAGASGAEWFFSRYETAKQMSVKVTEYTAFEYPENPGQPSPKLGHYDGRQLQLVQTGERSFDFIFRPQEEHIAEVAFRDIDVSLMTPGLPEYVRDSPGLQTIALVDRQWNRQQVQFPLPSPHVEITGGDGFEQEHVVVAALAKNCLNAGLWEVILYEGSEGEKRAFYHGWFTFPMGHYKRLWENNTGLSYWDNWNWYQMEHWLDPAGTVLALEDLREVQQEREITASYDPSETVLVGGEQIAKKRTLKATNVRNWGDFTQHADSVRFASFVPPGYYDVETPWNNEYWRIAEFEKAIFREIRSANSKRPLHELELVFSSGPGGGDEAPQTHRVFVGGIDLAQIPRLPRQDYPEGLYMPMGIGVPPFYQTYEELVANPPRKSPYYSFLVDGEDRWIDHHTTAIDGPVMHWDEDNERLLHLYFLSYERHSLVRHFELEVEEPLISELAESVL